MQLVVDSENKLSEAAKEIIAYSQNQKTWIFNGEMGAGKTTLIRAIATNMGIEDNVHSPTFSIVNEYANPEGKIFFHFDFYRIKSEEEAMDIGTEEYLDSGNICFIEWPNKIPSLLPEQYLQIDIQIMDHSSRRINLSHHGR